MTGDAALRDLRRLIAPRSIALIGAGAWTDAVAAGNEAIGFQGTVWRVHPTRTSIGSTTYYRSVADLPGSPDAAFIAVPNHEVPAVARALAQRDCGGFVCFSAGFSETGSTAGFLLTEELVRQAGSVPFFGPNCYGYVNFFDRAALLPDQVVGACIERGVALICQSGTIALTLMFSDRALPIGCLFTVGNQTRLSVENLIEVLCDDARISAFGLYLEGVKDAAGLARAAAKARATGKPIAVVKSGRTAAAARTAHSHTGALAGEDSVFDAFCRQAGLARCDTLATLCETLKVFHVGGALSGRRTLVMGASGGDMAMTADVARTLELDFAPLAPADTAALRELLTERVSVANPLDLHTYLWFDPPALGRVFRAVMSLGFDAVGFMLDSPPTAKADTRSYDAVIDEFIAGASSAAAAAATRPCRAALIASLPETMSPAIRDRCLKGGVVPLQGQREALEALSLAAAVGNAWRSDPTIVLQRQATPSAIAATALTESAGKSALADFGVPVPRGQLVAALQAGDAAWQIGFPVVIKASGAALAHKTEVGGVVLDVRDRDEADAAGRRLIALSETVLVEEMITDGIAEVLVGIIVDAQFGQVLVIGAGGILTELWADSVSLLPPWTPRRIAQGLERLTIDRLLSGFRRKGAGDRPALIDAIAAIGRYAAAHAGTLVEIDVNPLIVRPFGKGVVAVDTMIRHGHAHG